MNIFNKFGLIIIFSIYFTVSGQINVKDSSVFAPLFIGTYAVQIPGGDLADRFGKNSNIGFQFLIKSKKNILYGIGGTFLFGDNIRERDMLDGLKTSTGMIINNTGQEAEIYYYERGFHISSYFGRVFPIGKSNQNSGPFILGGLGFLQHKIRIDDFHDDVPELSKEYTKGYDRLTNGLTVSEMFGYQYLSNKRMINFYIGIEFIQGFTKNRRSYNFDEMKKDDVLRLDLLSGIKFGWIIPGYKKNPKEFYFY